MLALFRYHSMTATRKKWKLYIYIYGLNDISIVRNNYSSRANTVEKMFFTLPRQPRAIALFELLILMCLTYLIQEVPMSTFTSSPLWHNLNQICSTYSEEEPTAFLSRSQEDYILKAKVRCEPFQGSTDLKVFYPLNQPEIRCRN